METAATITLTACVTREDGNHPNGRRAAAVLRLDLEAALAEASAVRS
jgi:hypothetical protein